MNITLAKLGYMTGCFETRIRIANAVLPPLDRGRASGNRAGGALSAVVFEHGGQIEPAPADDFRYVKSVCQSWFGAVVGLAK